MIDHRQPKVRKVQRRLNMRVAAVICLVVAAAFHTTTTHVAHSDSKTLPEAVAEMRNAILDAAETGDLEQMRIPVELNEIMPVIGDATTDDPIENLRKLSPGATDATVLADMLKILELPPAVSADGTSWTWPYLVNETFAEEDSSARTVLAKTVPPEVATKIIEARKYTWFRLEIGSDGSWHYFGKGG